MEKIFLNSFTKNLFIGITVRRISLGKNMKNVDKNMVKGLERLALVDFPTEMAVSRLENCIQYADKLMEVDTACVDPLISTVSERNENVRNDVALAKSTREELMKIAPVNEEFYYVAPLGTFSRNQEKSS